MGVETIINRQVIIPCYLSDDHIPDDDQIHRAVRVSEKDGTLSIQLELHAEINLSAEVLKDSQYRSPAQVVTDMIIDRFVTDAGELIYPMVYNILLDKE